MISEKLRIRQSEKNPLINIELKGVNLSLEELGMLSTYIGLYFIIKTNTSYLKIFFRSPISREYIDKIPNLFTQEIGERFPIIQKISEIQQKTSSQIEKYSTSCETIEIESKSKKLISLENHESIRKLIFPSKISDSIDLYSIPDFNPKILSNFIELAPGSPNKIDLPYMILGCLLQDSHKAISIKKQISSSGEDPKTMDIQKQKIYDFSDLTCYLLKNIEPEFRDLLLNQCQRESVIENILRKVKIEIKSEKQESALIEHEHAVQNFGDTVCNNFDPINLPWVHPKLRQNLKKTFFDFKEIISIFDEDTPLDYIAETLLLMHKINENHDIKINKNSNEKINLEYIYPRLLHPKSICKFPELQRKILELEAFYKNNLGPPEHSNPGKKIFLDSIEILLKKPDWHLDIIMPQLGKRTLREVFESLLINHLNEEEIRKALYLRDKETMTIGEISADNPKCKHRMSQQFNNAGEHGVCFTAYEKIATTRFNLLNSDSAWQIVRQEAREIISDLYGIKSQIEFGGSVSKAFAEFLGCLDLDKLQIIHSSHEFDSMIEKFQDPLVFSLYDNNDRKKTSDELLKEIEGLKLKKEGLLLLSVQTRFGERPGCQDEEEFKQFIKKLKSRLQVKNLQIGDWVKTKEGKLGKVIDSKLKIEPENTRNIYLTDINDEWLEGSELEFDELQPLHQDDLIYLLNKDNSLENQEKIIDKIFYTNGTNVFNINEEGKIYSIYMENLDLSSDNKGQYYYKVDNKKGFFTSKEMRKILNDQQIKSESIEQIFIPDGTYLYSIWNEDGLFSAENFQRKHNYEIYYGLFGDCAQGPSESNLGLNGEIFSLFKKYAAGRGAILKIDPEFAAFLNSKNMHYQIQSGSVEYIKFLALAYALRDLHSNKIDRQKMEGNFGEEKDKTQYQKIAKYKDQITEYAINLSQVHGKRMAEELSRRFPGLTFDVGALNLNLFNFFNKKDKDTIVFNCESFPTEDFQRKLGEAKISVAEVSDYKNTFNGIRVSPFYFTTKEHVEALFQIIYENHLQFLKENPEILENLINKNI